MEEIWKDIPRYEGYQASTKGRIRTFNKVTYTEIHGYRQWKNRILKFKPSSFNSHSKKQGSGYRVTLWKDGKSKDFLVARLIATTFLEDLIDTNMTVNHKDGNRTNNNIENLEWLSRSENIKYGFEKGQYKQIKTILYNKKERKQFRSLSQADIFLERSIGYCSQILKRNKKQVKSKKNILYNIEIA